LDKYDAVGSAFKADWNCFAGNWWCARNDWLRRLPEPIRTADRFYYERWLLQGCENFKKLGKDCSGEAPYYQGEPCSTYDYFAGHEELYRPALKIGARCHTC
jgi:hypothetical protein